MGQEGINNEIMQLKTCHDKHTNAVVESPFRQKKISGVWGHVFGTDE